MKTVQTIFFLALIIHSGTAQESDSIQIANQVHTFFDGMAKHDTSLIKTTLYKDVKLETIFQNGEETKIQETAIGQFLGMFEFLKDKELEERISNMEIRIDGAMANAWMNYDFYVDEGYSHSGVNNFMFIKTKEGWKIFYIVDTRRKKK